MEKEKLNINIKIGEKNFPMKVESQEEERFRLAAKIAQDQYLRYKNNYTNFSTEDILSMVVFDLAKRNLDLQQKKENTELILELSDIVGTLGDYLKAQ